MREYVEDRMMLILCTYSVVCVWVGCLAGSYGRERVEIERELSAGHRDKHTLIWREG